MYCVDREKKIHEAAKEKRKDKELVNRRYRRGAAAQEQLEVTGRFNDPQGTDKLQWKSNFNTGWVLLSLCLKAQRHVGPLMTSNCTSSAHHTSTEQRRGCEMVRDYDTSRVLSLTTPEGTAKIRDTAKAPGSKSALTFQ